MHPVTHVLTGWTLANLPVLERWDRILVTLAVLIPDLDGLGVIADMATEHTSHPFSLYEDLHHTLLHNALCGIVLTVVVFAFARRRLLSALLALLGFHLHLLEDLVGSRGPDGYQWPIPYLAPFSEAWQRGRSPLELISVRADAALTRTLRTRFGTPVEQTP
jgi:hypothetical protein